MTEKETRAADDASAGSREEQAHLTLGERPETNIDFLAKIFRHLNAEVETVGCCSFPGDPGDPGVANWAIYYGATPHVKEGLENNEANNYFCISSVTPQPTKYLRRSQDALVATYVVVVDDVGSGPGAKMPRDQLPMPTYAVETSPDNYQYGYVLDKPITDPATARALIKLVTEEHGDSAAAIMGKLVRTPYGINGKAKYGSPAFQTGLAEWHPERVFSAQALQDTFGIDDETFKREYDRVSGFADRGVTAGQAHPSDEVFKFLEQQGMLLSESPGDTGYYDIICPWHESHTSADTGAKKAGYSPIGCGGGFAGFRQFHCFHEHCKARDEDDFLDWFFQERFVYNATANIVHDRANPTIRYSIEHFHTAMRPYHRVPQPEDPKGTRTKYYSRAWIDRASRAQVQDEIFMPGRPRVYRDLITGQLMFNSYEEIEHPLTMNFDKIEPILEQLRYLFGPEYENILSFLAYSVHRGEVRLPFALLHIASHFGTGRGWLKELCNSLFRHGYHYPASFHNFLNTSYNEFLYRTLLVTFDEVYDPDVRFTVGDRLRELITEQEVELNVKYGYKGKTPVLANLMFFSNHVDAVKLPNRDRRFWVVRCESEPRSAAVYKELYDLLTDEHGAPGEAVQQFYWYLKPYAEGKKNPEFNPRGRAPQTIWTEEVRDAYDDEEIGAPTKEVLAGLRLLGVDVIWREHLIRICKAAGVDLPHGNATKDVRSKHFRAILRENNVDRSSQRVKASPLLREKVMGGQHKEKDYVYFLSGEQRKAGGALADRADATIRTLEDAGEEIPPQPPGPELRLV